MNDYIWQKSSTLFLMYNVFLYDTLHIVRHNYYNQMLKGQGNLVCWKLLVCLMFLCELICLGFVNHRSRLSSHLSTSHLLCCSRTLAFLTGH